MRSIRNCNVAVVGGAGFLGSHLVAHLINAHNCNVLVMDNLCVGRREFIHKAATFIHCDITKSETYLKNIFRAWGAKFVFNYAAHPYIPDSFIRPLYVFETNATGAIQVINAAQEAGAEAILQVSSAELYGEGSFVSIEHNPTEPYGSGRINEQGKVLPHSSYGASKAAVDYYCQAAWKERGTPVIALRQFNCVGERETHPYVIPEIISQIAESYRKEKSSQWPRIIKLGSNTRRDFLYAGDAVKMAVELLEKGSFGEVYNLGSESSIPIYDLANLIATLVKAHIKVEEDPERIRPWEIWALCSDNTKINSVIESRPMVTLSEALRLTINYFKDNNSRWVWE